MEAGEFRLLVTSSEAISHGTRPQLATLACIQQRDNRLRASDRRQVGDTRRPVTRGGSLEVLEPQRRTSRARTESVRWGWRTREGRLLAACLPVPTPRRGPSTLCAPHWGAIARSRLLRGRGKWGADPRKGARPPGGARLPDGRVSCVSLVLQAHLSGIRCPPPDPGEPDGEPPDVRRSPTPSRND